MTTPAINRPKWLHIGAAKCASTSLQKSFFLKHPQLAFLGIGCGQSTSSWINPQLQRAIEVDLRCSAPHLYRAEGIKEVVGQAIEELWQPKHQRIGLSYENLSCSLGHDVSIVEKANRMHHLFGQNTKIIYVLRSQKELLISLYKDLLLNGATIEYQTFIERILFTRFQGIISDLQFFDIIECYSKLFGRDNILVLSFEELISNQKQSISDLCDFLEVEQFPHEISHQHSGLTAIQAHWLLKRNQSNRHDYGRDRFAIWHGERMQNYAKQDFNGWMPDELKENQVIAKESARLARSVNSGTELSFELNSTTEKLLHSSFAEGNLKLSKEYPVSSLPI